jgi:anti-sigma B factor antagonist
MVQRFTVESSCNETRCLLTVDGDVDVTTAPKLIVAGRDALRAGTRTIVVNLSGVAFMDSAGLAALINLHRSVDRAGGRLVVVCPDGPVRRLFAVSGTERLLGVEPPVTSTA